MKRCWRSWPRMTWKLSPHSSLWLTSAPEPPRDEHGTRPHRPDLPRRVAQVPVPGTVEGKGRRTAAMRGRGLPRWSSQPRLGAEATATNAHERRRVTTAHVLCTPTVATAPQNATRSSTSRSASVSDANSIPKTAPHLVADLAKKGSTTARWPRLNRTSGISHPRGTSKMFSPETPTPVATTRWSPVYGAEACLPPETLLDSPWVQPLYGSVQKRLQHGEVGSISCCRWKPWVET
jgi:hypothetical protein